MTVSPPANRRWTRAAAQTLPTHRALPMLLDRGPLGLAGTVLRGPDGLIPARQLSSLSVPFLLQT